MKNTSSSNNYGSSNSYNSGNQLQIMAIQMMTILITTYINL